MDFYLESSSDYAGSFFGIPSNTEDSKEFNQIYILEVEIQEQSNGLFLENTSLNQYLKARLDFVQECE